MATFPTQADGVKLAEDPSTTTSPTPLLGVPSLATTATRGYVGIPAVAGSPTGVPVVPAGYVAMCFDTTNHRLYVYENGAWHYFDRTA